MVAPSPIPVVVETGSDWLSFSSSIIGGVLGVAGGLLVYWLGQRSAARTERDEASVRAAGDLLAALAIYAHERGDERSPIRPGYGGSSASEEWLAFRVTAARMAPRLTDDKARQSVTAVLSAQERLHTRYYRKDLGETAAQEEWQERRRPMVVAIQHADETLVSYLERAARR